jgi:ankyrin repeat protein
VSEFEFIAPSPVNETLLANSSTRELCLAAAKGDVAEIKHLLLKSVNVNATDYDGRTALHIAASEGHEKVIILLLKVPEINVNLIDKNHRYVFLQIFSFEFLLLNFRDNAGFIFYSILIYLFYSHCLGRLFPKLFYMDILILSRFSNKPVQL